MCEPQTLADGASEQPIASRPAPKGTGVFHGPGSFPRSVKARIGGVCQPRRGSACGLGRSGSWFSSDRAQSPHRSHSIADFRVERSGSSYSSARPDPAASPPLVHRPGPHLHRQPSRSFSSSSDWMSAGRPDSSAGPLAPLLRSSAPQLGSSAPHEGASWGARVQALHLQLESMQLAEPSSTTLLPPTPGNSTSGMAGGGSAYLSDASVAAALAGVSDLLLMGGGQVPGASGGHAHSISPQLASPVCSMPSGSYHSAPLSMPSSSFHSAPVPIPVRPVALPSGAAAPYAHSLTVSGASPRQQLCASSINGGPARGGSPQSLLDSSPHMLLLNGVSGATGSLLPSPLPLCGGGSGADMAPAAAALPTALPLHDGGGSRAPWQSAISGAGTDCVDVDEAARRGALELIDNELLQLMQLKQSLTAAQRTSSVPIAAGGAACFGLAPPLAADVSSGSVAPWQLQHSQQDTLVEAQAKLQQLATMQQLQSQLEAELLQLLPA